MSGWAASGLRASGFWVGLFFVVNPIAECLRPGLDVSRAVVAADFLPTPLLFALLIGAGAALLLQTARPPARLRPRAIGAAAVGAVALLATLNAVQFYQALAEGTVRSPVPFPASGVIALLLTALAAQIARPPYRRSGWRTAASLAVTGPLLVIGFPLLLIATFGQADYGRSADCAIVFGAAVHPDGRLSLSLADRVDEGIRQYKAGRVKTLIMTGGIDPGNLRSEPVAMSRRAVEAGVPAEAIILDERGVNTAASARSVAALMKQHRYRSALAVSHYYHLPRIQLLLRRSQVRSFTVPARMSRRPPNEWYSVIREVAAFYNSLYLQ